MFDLHAASLVLANLRHTAETSPRLPPELRPQNFAEAWQLQQAVAAHIEATTGATIAGWKCGISDANVFMLAPIFSDSVQHIAAHGPTLCPLIPRHNLASIEPEFAFVMQTSLDAAPHYSEAEIDAAIGSTHLALELIFDRFEEPASLSFPENLADGLKNQGLLIGPRIENALPEVDLVLAHGDSNLNIKGKHPNLVPKAPLYALVNFLREQGMGLGAGQAIITGSIAGVWDVPLNAMVHIEYVGLGQFSTEFTPST